MKPQIAILPLWDDNRKCYWLSPGYMSAIEAAGGIPIMLPMTTDKEMIHHFANVYDGFIISGGQDLSPSFYGEDILPECGSIIPDLDTMEMELISEVVKQDKPLLGICRGLQFLNVALGGSLYQDLPTQYSSELCHRMEAPYDRSVHRVDIVPNTPFATIIGCESLQVNSIHHQAIKHMPSCVKETAISEDSLVEGIYMPDKKFIMAVQWHPELALETDMHSKEIFDAFVKACTR